MALSDTAIKKARAADKVQKLSDGGGLYLHIATTGGKLWRWAYRFEGKQKTMTFGSYPDVGLSQARERCQEARKMLALGTDPMAQRQADKLAALAELAIETTPIDTFESVAREWHSHWKASRSDSHVGQVLRRFEADVFPAIGARPIDQIKARELIEVMQAIQARGAIDVAARALQTASQVFRYAIVHEKATRNPAADIRPGDVLTARTPTNYARVEAKDLPALLRKIEGYQGTPVTRLAMKLLALTFVRTGELIGAQWDEFDLDAARWDIPAPRMKMKTPHVVPLSRQAVEVLRVLHGVTGNGDMLFPGERKNGKPMSNNTILMALGRMGYKGQMTGHGFRGIASTLLHEQGFDHAHIELQLAHAERNEVSAAYNHALYLKPRALMMQAWGDYLDGLTRGNVLPLQRLVA